MCLRVNKTQIPLLNLLLVLSTCSYLDSKMATRAPWIFPTENPSFKLCGPQKAHHQLKHWSGRYLKYVHNVDFQGPESLHKIPDVPKPNNLSHPPVLYIPYSKYTMACPVKVDLVPNIRGGMTSDSLLFKLKMDPPQYEESLRLLRSHKHKLCTFKAIINQRLQSKAKSVTSFWVRALWSSNRVWNAQDWAPG